MNINEETLTELSLSDTKSFEVDFRYDGDEVKQRRNGGMHSLLVVLSSSM